MYGAILLRKLRPGSRNDLLLEQLCSKPNRQCADMITHAMLIMEKQEHSAFRCSSSNLTGGKAFANAYRSAVGEMLNGTDMPKHFAAAMMRELADISIKPCLDGIVTNAVPLLRGIRQGRPESMDLLIETLCFHLQPLLGSWQHRTFALFLPQDCAFEPHAFWSALVGYADDLFMLADSTNLSIAQHNCAWIASDTVWATICFYGESIARSPSLKVLGCWVSQTALRMEP